MKRSVTGGLVAAAVLLALVGLLASVAVADPALGNALQSADVSQDEDDPESAEFTADYGSISSESFDDTTFEIVVYENGTADWTFRHERLLSDDEEIDAFEEFAEEFESEETDLYVGFTEQARALTDTGTDETDREMEATDFDRSADVEHRLNTRGVVEMSFTWSNFAAVDDGTVTVGDVFGGGLYIGSDQTLVVKAGDDLEFADMQPYGDFQGNSLRNSDSITWTGEREFIDGHPRVVLETPGTSETSADDGNGDVIGDSTPVALLGGLLALAAVGIGGAVVWYRSRGGEPASTDDGNVAASPATTDEPVEPEPLPEEELLTDEDRVVKLIRENGGRMKQVQIVEETGWSKSKVSMLLSEMEDEGTISKLRVGRENIISLEGFEPEATKSPFEE